MHWPGKLTFLVFFTWFSTSLAAVDDSLRVSQVSLPKLPSVSRTAAIYLTLENLGENKLTLIGVETPVAQHAMIHQTAEVDGMVKMQHQNQVEIMPGAKLVFQPGSYHIMLMGVNRKLLEKPFTLTLKFAHHPQLTVNVIP